MADEKNVSLALPPPHFVDAVEAARLLSMSESWFWARVADGKMPAGRRWGAKATRWVRDEVIQAGLDFGMEKAEA